MSLAKAYKPAHGGYPGVVHNLRQALGLNRPENKAPAPLIEAGTQVRIVQQGNHYLQVGSIGVITSNKDVAVLGYDVQGTANDRTKSSGDTISQWLNPEDFEVL